MKSFLKFFMLACLLGERDGFFGRYWETPLRYVALLLFESKLVVMPVVDACILLMLFGSQRPPAGPNPMTKAIRIAIITVAATATWGIVTGGSPYQIQFQVHTLVMSLLLALAIRRILQTPEDYVDLGWWLVIAATYRGFLCAAFYVLVIRTGALEKPPTEITSHDDSVLFVVGFVALVLHAVLRPSPRHPRAAVMLCAVFLLGIQFNNRRLAWGSLLAALATAYAALPSSPTRRVVNRSLLRVAPILALYVIVGWERPEAVFKPLRSLSSMSSGDVDDSTRSRDNENVGLLVTLTQNPALGTGWGHEYTEVDDTLAPKGFVQYRYLPHNSVLGLLAFTGFMGFAGLWLIYPVCACLALRVSQLARDDTLRMLGMGTLAIVVAVIAQLWGDMGLLGYPTMFILSAGMACASHLPEFAARDEEYAYAD